MNIILNKHQEALLMNGWSLRVARGILELHYYWERSKFMYGEDSISAEQICKKHKVRVE